MQREERERKRERLECVHREWNGNRERGNKTCGSSAEGAVETDRQTDRENGKTMVRGSRGSGKMEAERDRFCNHSE